MTGRSMSSSNGNDIQAEGRVPSVWQYGVMYPDGSVSRRWNGNTQEKRAREEVVRYYDTYPGTTDNVRVVRRLIGPWEEA